jgi:platelet-activating factor acetylhydrolase
LNEGNAIHVAFEDESVIPLMRSGKVVRTCGKIGHKFVLRSVKLFMFSKLPSYRGKYNVGFIDVETKPKEILPDQGLFFRIYYPTTQPVQYTSWLPNNWEYSHGYGNFLKSSRFLVSLLYYPFFSMVRIPMLQNPPIAQDLPQKLPVCIFSHGLAGMRTTYSNLCGNLASRGFIVVAVEHGDGSSCFTKRNHEVPLEIHHHHPKKEEMRDGETENDYLLRLRSTQLNHRRDEILEAITLMEDLETGNLEHVLHRGEVLDNFLMGLKGRIDFDNMMIMGHSFGVPSVHVGSNVNSCIESAKTSIQMCCSHGSMDVCGATKLSSEDSNTQCAKSCIPLEKELGCHQSNGNPS